MCFLRIPGPMEPMDPKVALLSIILGPVGTQWSSMEPCRGQFNSIHQYDDPLPQLETQIQSPISPTSLTIRGPQRPQTQNPHTVTNKTQTPKLETQIRSPMYPKAPKSKT